MNDIIRTLCFMNDPDSANSRWGVIDCLCDSVIYDMLNINLIIDDLKVVFVRPTVW